MGKPLKGRLRRRSAKHRDPFDLPFGADPLDGPVDAGRRPTPPKLKRPRKPAKPGALARALAHRPRHAP